jgi:ADP-ribosylglycohydrolase
MMTSTFSSKLEGALYGVAIGDGMGAPVEGWSAAQILERFSGHDFNVFLPVTHDREPTVGKGDGRITDDTLMTEALIRAYNQSGRHLDAYGFREYLVPEFTKTVIWLPEYGKDMALLGRLNPIERYTEYRLNYFGAYPRHAGIGNSINCGVAMYIMPTGAVNAADPDSAFREAIALAMAETDSYGVESAAVLAAAYAEAFDEAATIETVCACALEHANDGTKSAIGKALQATHPGDALPEFIEKVRHAFIPFDPKARAEASPGAPGDADQPSRLLSIEELPVALAALVYGGGDFLKTIRAGVCYGRDCDSIAGMACGLLGALFGESAIPQALKETSDVRNRRDFKAMASGFEKTVRQIHQVDAKFAQRKSRMLG